MKGTEYQTTRSTTHSPMNDAWTGVAPYATHTPLYPPPATGTYPYGQAHKTAGPSNRVAIIGATGVALLLVAMGGLAYVRSQDAVAPTAAETVTTLMVPQSVYAQQVPFAARITVPHAATAELAATMAVPVTYVPQSVYAQQVPQGAAAELADTLEVARSTYAEQVPMTARITVPQSTVDSQVPEEAR